MQRLDSLASKAQMAQKTGAAVLLHLMESNILEALELVVNPMNTNQGSLLALAEEEEALRSVLMAIEAKKEVSVYSLLLMAVMAVMAVMHKMEKMVPCMDRAAAADTEAEAAAGAAQLFVQSAMALMIGPGLEETEVPAELEGLEEKGALFCITPPQRKYSPASSWTNTAEWSWTA